MRILVFFAMIFAISVSSSIAQVTVFTDRGDWEAAVGGTPIVVEGFNDVDPFVFSDGETLMTSNLSVTRDGSGNAGDGFLAIADGSEFGNIDGTNFLDGETGIDPHEVVNIGFLGNSVFAFGADFFSPFSGDGIGLSVGGELILLDSISGFDTGFVGIVSTDGFTSIDIVGNPDTATFQELWSADNLSFAVVPEPGSATCCAAFLLCAAYRRRRV